MRKRFLWAMLAVAVMVCGLNVQRASATSSNVVISQVQVGDAISASDEFIELYNNSQTDTEITNWCMYYASASSVQLGNKLGCFIPSGELFHVYLPAHTSAYAISTILSSNQPNIGSDVTFSAGLSGTAGHVRIVDSTLSEIDKVGWGMTAMSPETVSAPVPTVGKLLQRKPSAVQMILRDTDNNSADFELSGPKANYTYGAIYEVEDVCANIADVQLRVPENLQRDLNGNCISPPSDTCSNIDGFQPELPVGVMLDADGLCQMDVCQNLTGLQGTVPDGFDANGGNCMQHDYCSNVIGIQTTIPDDYFVDELDICLYDLQQLRLSELLANPNGSDEGSEFVELFNPNNSDVDLTFYRLTVGSDNVKTYSFPAGANIVAGGYAVFTNADMSFTLINSGSAVGISSVDNQSIDSAVHYLDPQDGMAWALIDGTWQYTNQPTPGSQNLVSIIDPGSTQMVMTTNNVKPCAPNQYRSPDTNRCRLIDSSSSTLAPCKDGQYRSEITNRCRSIAADVSALTPCAVNQERSPDTNRCRLITSAASVLAPCNDGQERNPDTNRCRNVVSSDIPTVGFAVEPIDESPTMSIGWWAAGGLTAVALLYAGWEWRVEVLRFLNKIGSFIPVRK